MLLIKKFIIREFHCQKFFSENKGNKRNEKVILCLGMESILEQKIEEESHFERIKFLSVYQSEQYNVRKSTRKNGKEKDISANRKEK